MTFVTEMTFELCADFFFIFSLYLTQIFSSRESLTFKSTFPSEAHATAGRRPAVARSEQSERSVREALLQKIDLKNMSHTMTSQKKKCVPH